MIIRLEGLLITTGSSGGRGRYGISMGTVPPCPDGGPTAICRQSDRVLGSHISSAHSHIKSNVLPVFTAPCGLFRIIIKKIIHPLSLRNKGSLTLMFISINVD